MKQVSIAILALATAGTANAQVQPYGQCGGSGWTGPTSCVSGWTCVYSNDWYSQCLEGSAGTTATTTTKTTTTKTSSTKTTTTKTTTAKTSSTKTTKFSTTKTSKTSSSLLPPTNLPASAGSTAFPSPIIVTGVFDGGMMKYDRNPSSCEGQTETDEAAAMFIIEAGGVVKNVIIGPNQGEGIHCRGPCTIQNVWWEDVCEDAATFKQTSGDSYIIGGGAFHAQDKIFQFNGRGTVHISDGFYAKDYGKVSRSCGDCTNNGGPRNFVISGITAVDGGPLCGINTNYGDTCRISNSCQSNGKDCDRYQGVVKGNGSSKKLGTGADGVSCFVDSFTTNCS
ncbi:hypothetical protein H072_3625 [Dactylellina haptotyla CBS 200.50]|uniref:Pectate lyase n=1 Tax=Dactylellina haptotyla (strain CBS 200.50) TaxID=1284197 RepID=S8AHU9_DACHA|nr:hypothetical protein H072_3625 [Dactylellina haptotyla CBS 200.50]